MTKDPRSWPPHRVAAAAVLLTLVAASAGYVLGRAATTAPGPPGPGEDPLEARGWRYLGIKHVAGPGTGALPLLPLDVDDRGRLVGQPTVTTRIEGGNVEDATLDVRPWFSYCGRHDAPGLQGNWTGDNLLRYHDIGRWIERDGEHPDLWYSDRHGEPIEPEEIPVGKPVYASWRTPDDAGPKDLLLFSLLKRNATEVPPFPYDLPLGQDGLMAWSSLNTHFCSYALTQPIGWSERFNRTHAKGRYFPWVEGVPHLARSTTHLGTWDPNRVVEDRWTTSGFPAADGGSTRIPPLPGGD